MADQVYTVHEITDTLQELLEGSLPPLWVEGEVSNFRESPAGHWYFILKDDRSQLPCVVFRNVSIRHQHLRPEEGVLRRVFGGGVEVGRGTGAVAQSGPQVAFGLAASNLSPRHFLVATNPRSA